MKLIRDVNEAIWNEYKSYKEVRFYVGKWHQTQETWNDYWENFPIKLKETGDIDLVATLNEIDGQTLLQIAVDLGVDTPDFIPSVATFRNEIKSDYRTASATFEKAFREIEIHPDIAIGLANSGLESIIKEILKDDRLATALKGSETLYDLASHLLKVFKLFPSSELPLEVKTIGSNMLSTCKAVEGLRSTGTSFHGRTDDEYLINDPLYTYLVVNSVTTVGLFLNGFYRNKFPKVLPESASPDDDNLPW